MIMLTKYKWSLAVCALLYFLLPVDGLTGDNVCTRTVSKLEIRKIPETVTVQTCDYVMRNGRRERVCRTKYQIKITVKAMLVFSLETYCCPNSTQINNACVIGTTTSQPPTTTLLTNPTTTPVTTVITAIPALGSAQLAPNSVTAGAAVGGVFGALIALAVIAVLAVVYRRRVINKKWSQDALYTGGDDNRRSSEGPYQGIEGKPYEALHTYGNEQSEAPPMYEPMKSTESKPNPALLYDMPKVVTAPKFSKTELNSENGYYNGTVNRGDGYIEPRSDSASSLSSSSKVTKGKLSERILAFERKQSPNNVMQNQLYYI